MGGSAEAGEIVDVPGYVVGELIGSGGFGEVFRATHAVIGREAAIKVLHAKYSSDAEAVARFVAEARAVNKISHPAIVEIFDFGQLASGRQYCVMELIRGRTLREVLRDRERLPLDDALPILRGIAEAIDAAHVAGIAHRDLKPDNVFVLDGGGVKLIDFGLAKLVDEEVAITQTGSVFGTPLYMSPEQCRGRQVSLATDAYSFGVLAYHVLTGSPPFVGDALELALHHLNDEPEAPSRRCSELDARVDRVVLALMGKDPEQRPRSLVEAIAAIAGDAALPARPRRRFRARWLAPVPVAGVIAYLALRPPAVIDDCAAPAERLAGIWDAPVRDRLAARFAAAHRPDVNTTWRIFSAEVDGYASQWGSQWTAACHSEDRKKDPLLYGQRLTCLETALLEYRGYVEAVGDLDVIAFTQEYDARSLLTPLEDCTSLPVLRAQPAAPPPELREEVGRLASEVFRGRRILRTAIEARRPELIEQGLARIDEATKRLDALDVPEAATAWVGRAGILQRLAFDARAGDDAVPQAKRLELARTALETATRRATELRNDQALAWASLLEVRFAARAGGSNVDEALARAAAAVERAGRPAWAAADLASERSGIALARGDLVTARRELDTAWAVWQRADADLYRSDYDASLADLALEEGKIADAIALWDGIVARTLQRWGADHPLTIRRRLALLGMLQLGMDDRRSVEQLDAIITTDERLGASPIDLAEARMRRIALAWHLGQRDRARSELAALGDPARRGSAIAELALTRGDLDLAELAIAAAGDPPGDLGATIENNRAYLSFMHGDRTAMREHAARAATAGQAGVLGLALLAYADASEGRASSPSVLALMKYAGLRDRPRLEIVVFGRMLVMAAQHHWDDAVKLARELVQVSAGASATADQAESNAWLGLALVETGQPGDAIAPLEASLAVLHRCCNDFHYYAPIAQLALARALAATGGDLARARSLAETARDGFARLGPHREPDREAAIQWLAAHQQ